MKLREWRKEAAISQREFGNRVGVSDMQVSRWERGVQIPRKEKMALIEEATKGEVGPTDFYERVA